MAVLAEGTSLSSGRFIIGSLLGRGSAGEVYLARQPRMDREVAIKVLSNAVAEIPDALRRFEREARAAGGLVHPNVLPVFDFDFDEPLSLWYLAMQYVPGGGTLKDRLGKPQTVAEMGALIRGLAGALDTAHAHGIVHRDVKPANVLLDHDRPMLTDFGLAHLSQMPRMTATGLVVGTPIYMAPEQALGRPAGPAADQYALAIIAYELVAGRPPFRGFQMAILHQHVHDAPPPLEQFNPDLDAAAREAIGRALAKEVDERFPSCTAFAQALSA